MCLVEGRCDDDPFASSQSVSLDNDRRSFAFDVGVRGGCVGKGLEARRRDTVPDHEALGEILGTFELCRFPGWPENFQAARPENVDHASCQGRFGADDGKMDFFSLGEISQRLRIGQLDVFQFRLAGGSGIARCDINTLHAGRFCQAPGQRVFASTGTDDE